MVSRGQTGLVLDKVDLSIAPPVLGFENIRGRDQSSLVLGFRGTSC